MDAWLRNLGVCLRAGRSALGMDELRKGQTVRILPCTHVFHSRCIDKWLKSNNSCPIDKIPLKAEGQ